MHFCDAYYVVLKRFLVFSFQNSFLPPLQLSPTLSPTASSGVGIAGNHNQLSPDDAASFYANFAPGVNALGLTVTNGVFGRIGEP